MKKIQSLQVLRAAAALLVVYTHAIHYVSKFADPLQRHFFSLADFGAAGVDIFFCISGFILAASILRRVPEPGDFLLRRSIRIFPMVWVASTLALCAKYISYGSHSAKDLAGLEQSPTVTAAATHHPLLHGAVRMLTTYMVLPTAGYPLPVPFAPNTWTLMFEMLFYYYLALSLAVWFRAPVAATISIIMALVAAGAVAGFQRPVLIFFANPWMLEFALGCSIAYVWRSVDRSRTLGWLALAGGLLWFGREIIYGFGSVYDYRLITSGAESWQRVYMFGLPAFLVVLGTVGLNSSYQSRFGKLFVFLGDASYSIYLFQWLPLVFWRSMPSLLKAFPADVAVIVTVATMTGTGIIMHVVVERPITGFLTELYHRHIVAKASVGAPRVSSRLPSESPLRGDGPPNAGDPLPALEATAEAARAATATDAGPASP